MTCTAILSREIMGWFTSKGEYKLRHVIMHKQIDLPYPPFIGLNVEFESNEEPDFQIERITFSRKRWAYVCSHKHVTQQQLWEIRNIVASAVDETVLNLTKYGWVTDSDSLNDENIS